MTFGATNFQVDIKEGVEVGGGGSDQNFQLMLSSCITLSIVYKHYHPMFIPFKLFLLMPDVSSPQITFSRKLPVFFNFQ